MTKYHIKNIFDDISDSLKNNEWILWKRSDTVNLLKFIYYFILIIIILALICCLFILIVITGYLIFLIIVGIIILGISACIRSIKKGYRNLKELTGLIYGDLKQFPYYEVITNKRYIRKDFYLVNNTDFSEYEPNSIEIVNNILYLNMDYIEKIVIDLAYQRIDFLIRGNNDKLFRDIYIEYSEKEYTTIGNILVDILNLEKIKENKENILYRRKKHIEN
ncbi:MAG: hypothetical protein KGD57_09770 [Candidatus Lokiarchaeota archaeon]|nr:hypothetical protein [Candidatus Lokiarchaeota archaeon]